VNAGRKYICCCTDGSNKGVKLLGGVIIFESIVIGDNGGDEMYDSIIADKEIDGNWWSDNVWWLLLLWICGLIECLLS